MVGKYTFLHPFFKKNSNIFTTNRGTVLVSHSKCPRKNIIMVSGKEMKIWLRRNAGKAPE